MDRIDEITALEKAEAVLASFRGEVECPSCHHYVKMAEIPLWQHDIDGSEFVVHVCRDCWYDTMDRIDKCIIEAFIKGRVACLNQ